MTRFTAPLIALLLCGTALTGCASDKPSTLGVPKNTAAAANAATPVSDAPALPTDIESNVRQAQAQRLTGHYDEAIHTLSQLMLVASDDPRVVGEYGKTLTEKGRAQDAVQFLTRATELQPTEWSFYSALGVAYDQVGDQAAARTAYEHALRLKPNDPSVLNNYALSRMLANDPVMARQLIARAQAAGGASDPKIARNIELVNKLAADAPVPVAAAEPKAAPVVAATVPVSAPVPVSSSPLPPAAASAQNMPAPQSKAQPAPKVVMQADPLAGPAKTASHEPTPLATHAVAKANDAAPKADMKAAAKIDTAGGPVKADAKPVKAADAKPDMKTEAKPIKLETASTTPPALKTDLKPVKAADAKLDTKSAKVETAGANPASVKIDLKPMKDADVKPDMKTEAKAVKLDTASTKPVKTDAKPVKAADAKTDVKSDAKTGAKPAGKNAIPALRQTADASNP